MVKKKAAKKSKTVAKKAAKKSTATKAKKNKKSVDLVEIRKDIANMVGSEATELALAVVNVGKTGQLAQVKYLFEMAGLYPANGETREEKPQDNALARTLLHRLGLPEEPVMVQEDEVPLKLELPMTRAVEEFFFHKPVPDEQSSEKVNSDENGSSEIV